MPTITRPVFPIDLPSDGKPYLGEIPPTVHIHPMRAVDEKLMLGSGGDLERFNAVNTVLSNCLLEKIDTKNLLTSDRFYLMIALRIHSYGEKYEFITKCPECGYTFKTFCNLNELGTAKLPDDFVEPYPLEISTGDILGLRLLRGADEEQITRAVLRSLSKKEEGDLSYIPRLKLQIVTVNEEKLTPHEHTSYVENMTAADSHLVQKTLDKMDSGLLGIVDLLCARCGAEFESGLPMQPSLFRP